MSENLIAMQASYDVARQQLLNTFPWTEPFIIRIPFGYVAIVSELLTLVEEIYSPESISFLRIITTSRDGFKQSEVKLLVSALELKIFIDSTYQSPVKDAALRLHFDQITAQVDRTCYLCGAAAEAMQEDELLGYCRVISKSAVCVACSDAAYTEYGYLFIKEPNIIEDNQVEDEPDEDKAGEENKEASSSLDVVSANRTNSAGDPDLEDTEDPEAAGMQPHTVTLFSLEQVENLKKSIGHETRDQKNRLEALVKKLNSVSPEKTLTTIPSDWLSLCDTLGERFPNFSDVVVFIRNQFALSSVSEQLFSLPPFLLVGPPGVGKSEFLLTLAETVGNVLKVIDIANAQTGTPLTGSESYWSNTQPGMLFNTLVFGDIANPIILLEEVDKKSSRSDLDPLAALHGLLEDRQAKQFTDLSVRELTIDASHINWCATANEERFIQQSILDRFAIFNIALPTTAEMRVIVQNQYQKFISSHNSGGYFDATLTDEDVIQQLSNAHPRKVKKLLEHAFAVAALEKRSSLKATDIISSEKAMLHHRRIGFI